jgi:hypothetical protein
MMVVVTPDALCQAAHGVGSTLACGLQIVLQLREGALRGSKISRLKSLPQCFKITADRIAGRRGRLTAL